MQDKQSKRKQKELDEEEREEVEVEGKCKGQVFFVYLITYLGFSLSHILSHRHQRQWVEEEEGKLKKDEDEKEDGRKVSVRRCR